MKNIKKLLGIAMVLAMVLSLGASAFAQYVGLPADAAGHDMVAYQIFDGRQLQGKDGSSQLGINGWASDVNGDQLLQALKDDPTYGGKFAECKTAVDVATVFGQQGDTADIHDGFNLWLARFMEDHKDLLGTRTEMYKYPDSTNLSDGYWVIIDETDPATLAANNARSTVILEVVGNETVELRDKIDKPTVEKKVNDKDADVSSLGQPNEFKLTATLPSNFADYLKYYLTFDDTMSPGFDLDEGSFMIQYGSAEPVAISTGSVTTNDDGTHFLVKTKELRQDTSLAAGSTIVLTYKASLNDKAVIGEPGNPNEVKLHYSNDPNWNGGGEEEPPTGTTPPDTAIVFTFKVDGYKVDGNNKPLAGAGFSLYKVKEDGSTDVFAEKSKFGVEMTVQYGEDEYALYRDEIEVTEVTDTDGNVKYAFDFGQLGEGQYLLVETTVPAGYNRADDIAFSIELVTDEAGNNTGATVLDANGEQISEAIDIVFPDDNNLNGRGTGVIPELVQNRTGLELPQTGGIGTTIFYVVGAVLVVGAVILLVTRKRVGNK